MTDGLPHEEHIDGACPLSGRKVVDANGQPGDGVVVENIAGAVANEINGVACGELYDALEALSTLGVAQVEPGDAEALARLAKAATNIVVALEAYREKELNCEPRGAFGRKLRQFAHDIGNPMWGLSLNAGSLRECECNDPYLPDILEDMDLAVAFVAEAIRGFLGTLNETPRPVVLVEILNKFVGDMAQVHAGLSVNVNDESGLADILEYDPSDVSCLLNNFASNAVKHGKASRLDVTVYSGATGEVCIEVSDNGCGLPGDFDFDAAVNSEVYGENGNGMRDMWNLSIGLGGKLELLSKKPARFRVTLPAAEDQLATEETGEPPMFVEATADTAVA